MFDLSKRPWRRLGRATTGVVSLAVVTSSMVALAAVGSADAAPRTGAAPDAAGVQAVRSAAVSAASVFNQVRSTSKVTGTTRNKRKVTGTFTPAVARVSKTGELRVRGTLHGVVHNFNGSVTKFSKGFVWMPVKTLNGKAPGAQRSAAATGAALAAASCKVLDLVLGPLHLDLLGLHVDLQTVDLKITAVPGPGNLLGNLLCAVAGLLDGTPLSGLLSQLSGLLTSIFAILRA